MLHRPHDELLVIFCLTVYRCSSSRTAGDSTYQHAVDDVARVNSALQITATLIILTVYTITDYIYKTPVIVRAGSTSIYFTPAEGSSIMDRKPDSSAEFSLPATAASTTAGKGVLVKMALTRPCQTSTRATAPARGAIINFTLLQRKKLRFSDETRVRV